MGKLDRLYSFLKHPIGYKRYERAKYAVTFPLMLAVALAIKWEGPGPIFERQTCIGRGSRRFQLLKFRTMALDPDHTAPAWARKTTRIGEFLHYTRIENLPQLYNLLLGEISLIDHNGSSPSSLD